VPAPPEPVIPAHLLGYLGSLKGSSDLDSDARRNGWLALPFSKEEDRYGHADQQLPFSQHKQQ